ncbi:DUF4136 domain-containing protein [Echinicola sp. 20G]|uniref:DUF4136 domain-containing protein n=1 Tax=Echinicola sp. 20G TaxID=2781961 RepID=UPI0019104D13|nr:DUF4136 domain-containing protein [Echinicola sp. 20G]
MKRYIAIATALMVSIILNSCSVGKVLDTSSAPDFSISDYQSFDFYKTDLDITEMPEYGKRVDWIKEAIKNKLSTMGIEQDTDNPDLLVNIGIVLEEKVQTRETDLRSDPPMYVGQRNYHWEVQEVPVGTYKEGTFTVDLVDKETDKMVWQGISQGVITENDEKAKKYIVEGVNNLMSEIEEK